MVSGQTRGPGTCVPAPRARPPRALQAAGVGRSRALRFRTCQARGGLGRRRDPGPPRPKDLGAELQAGRCRPGPSAAPLRRPGGRGRSPPRGGARGGARGVPSRPASGPCLPGPRALPEPGDPPGGWVSPSARPASGQLTWAPRRRLPRSAPPARLGSVRFGSPREEPPGLRLARGGASGSELIGRGPAWSARARRSRGRAPGPAET